MDNIEKELDKLLLDDLANIKDEFDSHISNISILPKNAKSRKETAKLLKQYLKYLE